MNGTAYTFTVAATNSVGPGRASDPSGPVVPHLPGAPTVTGMSPTHVPTAVTDTQVTFTIPPGAATGYIKVLGLAGSTTSAAVFTVTG